MSQSVRGRLRIHFTATIRSHIRGINNRYSSGVSRATRHVRSTKSVPGDRGCTAPAGLCVSATAPIAGVLAGTIAVALVMLVSTAGALLAADWRADQQSRQTWAEVAPALAEWNPVVRGEAGDIETRYLLACDNDALRDMFRVNRFLPPQGAAVMELPDVRRLPGSHPHSRCRCGRLALLPRRASLTERTMRADCSGMALSIERHWECQGQGRPEA